MVDETKTVEERDAADATAGGHPRKGGLRRLISSVLRLVDVQYRIMMLRAKLTLVRMAIFGGLFAGTLVLGLVGVVFLYIGVFRLLTDYAGLPVWGAFLIYAGVHLITAGILISVAMRMITGRDESDEDEKVKGGGA